ncbi:spermatogenesis-associated serine-rich protein 2 isoform X6 [Falco cherrug]|uniref:spermatogenesis-associated serine-rich protein 2 isoform X6 n=1 Tax=Falco cherrug TaxID=345164 RepID=UPI002478F697|nr:spermatogenesis-associated serine-rich protein 2 isoform X6 [Falco cherrug]
MKTEELDRSSSAIFRPARWANPSGFIFDVQSNTVMAQGGTFENMKEKINAVRAIVPNRSNNEIVLVLQHFDNCVDKTVQAFMEGNASEVLKEWTVTGKKKNKKKKTKPKPQAESNPGLPEPGKLVSTEEEQSANSEKGGINGFHVNGCAHDTESVDSLSEGLDALSIDARELEDCEPAAPDMPDRTASNSTPASLSVTRLEDVPVSPVSKKLGSNIEKSVKDLQRCTVSLARYRVVVKEEMDASIKKMKQAFAELQSSLMDREVALLAEMDKVKAEAMEILVSRQKKAEALKKLTDVAVRMSEEQLVELRADIKHFVSERKYDEDLGRVARFTCDLDALKKSIASFGQDVSLPVSHHQEQLLHPLAVQLRHRRVPERSPARPPLPLPPACASASAASLTAAKRTLGGGGRGERRQPPPAAPQRGFPRAAASGSGAQSPGPAPHRPPPAATTATDRGTGSPPPPAPSPPRPASARATAGAPPPPAQRPRGGFPQPKGGLPQRKPRASRQEGANS